MTESRLYQNTRKPTGEPRAEARTSMSAPTIEFIDLAAQRRRLGERIDAAIARVLAHGRFILGPEVSDSRRNCKRSLAPGIA